MPPKAKFTKREIIEKAVGIIEERGPDALTARSLGTKLGSSSRPIFTAFSNMEEVFDECLKYADLIYTRDYVQPGLEENPAFKGVGKSYIRFASERPELFGLLFMRDSSGEKSIKNILGKIETNYDLILSSIVKGYALSVDAAEKLYRHMWLYTHGIAVSIATGLCSFTQTEVSDMLTEVFVALLKQSKEDQR